MREIKFRCWHRRRNKGCVNEGKMSMSILRLCDLINVITSGYEFKKVGVYGYDEHYELDDESIIMQYTGLKDKNDKEIYEGDIVKCEMKGFNIENSVIEYIENGYWIKDKYEKCHLPNKEYREVIGNIYENPELLKKVV